MFAARRCPIVSYHWPRCGATSNRTPGTTSTSSTEATTDKGRTMASIKRIDHVAIAVRDADQATQQFVNLLNAIPIRTEILREKAGSVKVSYLQIGESVLSLVQSM